VARLERVAPKLGPDPGGRIHTGFDDPRLPSEPAKLGMDRLGPIRRSYTPRAPIPRTGRRRG